MPPRKRRKEPTVSTTFPITVDVNRLIEFLAGPNYGTIRTISQEEIGRDCYVAPSPTGDDSCGAQMLLMALNGKTAEEIRAWLHESEEAAAWRNRPPEPQPPEPQPPEPEPIPPQPEPGPVPPANESGDLRVERPTICDPAGIWQWRGFTDFLLFYRFLVGVDLTPFLNERITLGANVLRVFSMVGWD